MSHSIVHTQRDLVEVTTDSGAVALLGPNFSGRTDLLRTVCGLPPLGPLGATETSSVKNGIYIGPESDHCLSGLAATVDDELLLHTSQRSFTGLAERILQSTGLREFGKRNPFTLSGGEQACLALATACLTGPSLVAADCLFEQLSSELLTVLMQDIFSVQDACPAVVFADNRVSEWPKLPIATARVEQFATCTSYPPPPTLSAKPLNSLPSVEPCDIELDDIAFAYGRGRPILESASLKLKGGNIYTLHGRNGAGKSTFAKLLAGVIKPTAGRVLLDGQQIQTWRKPGTIAGYHFQNPDLQLFSTSVYNEVKSGIPVSASDRESIVQSVLTAFGLAHVANRHPLDLPFVMRKRVALASTVAMSAPWLILDEPSLGQDNAAAIAIADAIGLLSQNGRGILVISHSRWFRSLLSATDIVLENGAFDVKKGRE